MAIEIERKYIVKNLDFLSNIEGIRFLQGYIFQTDKCVARVRLSNENAWFTLKGPTRELERDEFEYEIPLKDARQILNRFCVEQVVDKTRYKVYCNDICWEIDVFHGENEGLCIAEVELETIDQQFAFPIWLGEEVSQDSRYFNSQLARNPYKEWMEK